jgi:uncharacterized protein DUF4255
MATFHSVSGVLEGLKFYLEQHKDMLGGITASVDILTSKTLQEGPKKTNKLGIYLHRISIDTFGRNRHLPPKPGITNKPRKELPLNLHILLIGWSESSNEQILLAWAMQVLGSGTELDIADIIDHVADREWGEQDKIQVIPEDMSTEDFMRIWDSLPHDYILSSPYILKTVRLEPVKEMPSPRVESIVLPYGESQ